MGAIGDLFFNLLFQDSQVTAEAKRAGAKAGDAAGQSMAGRIRANLGPAVASGIGTVLGAGFAIAAKGAAELDAATRQFQADTGATAEEARQASHAIAGMYRDNLQGFDQISAALAKVHTDIGLTGTEAERATEQFLKFGTATGQDAADAVSSFDDILDAWNLTAADTPRIMDLLIASHQKYGGSIEDNERALSQLAPQLQALGADTDDGIKLLNLFAASGLDASKATFALNTAVRTLEPGQNLDDLIKRISAIEDPTLRAQEAIKVFGSRGGVSLANALRPGVNSLDAFGVTMEETEGATERAADAIESSFGNQFQLLIKNAGGALAEFGNNFGPLLLVASQFGPKMITAIGAGLGAIAGRLFPGLIAKILPGAVAAGTTTGTAMGAAAATAEVASQTTGVVAGQAAVGAAAAPAAAAQGTLIGRAMGLAAAAAVAAIPITIAVATAVIGDQVLEDIKTDIEKRTSDAIAEGSAEGLQVVKRDLEQRLRIARAGHLSGPMLDSLVRQLAEVDEALANPTGSRAPRFGGSSPDDRGNEWTSGWSRGVDTLHRDLVKATDAIKTSNDPKIVSEAIASALASVVGGRGSAETTRGLIDDLKAQLVVAEAANNGPLAQQIKAAIAQLEPFAKGRQWQAEQLDKAQRVVDSNKSTADKVAELRGIQGELLSHQRTMAADIVAKQIQEIQAINKVRNALGGILFSGRAPGKEKDDTFTPPKKPKPKAPMFGGKSPDDRAAGGPVTAGQPYWVGEQGIPELFVPRASGAIVPAADVPGIVGGNTTINVPIQGLIPYRDAMTIPNELKRLRDFGVLTPRRSPSRA